jgi:uncharacterized membrane protein
MADLTFPATQRSWAQRLFWIVPSAVGLAAAVAIASRLPRIARAADAGQGLHGPDLGLFAAQPLVIQAHILAALATVGLGAVMMLSRKGARFHRRAGWLWAALMAGVALTSLFIVGANGDKWSYIHIASGWALVLLPIALVAARRHNVATHRRAMMGLYFGILLIAGALTFLPGRLMWRLFFG